MSAPVLIFGATGGIGSALARELAKRGTPLFLSGRNPKRLQSLALETRSPCFAADVTAADSVETVVSKAMVADSLAGIAYCVGSIIVRPLQSVSDDDFLAAFRLNVLGAVRAVRAARGSLAAGNGSVVLFSTVAVDQGFANHTVIAAAKGAVEGVTRALAAELAPGVRVNAVAPSLTRTPLAEPLLRNEAVARGIAQLHALPRLGEPEDIARAAAYLLGPESGWITGQVLHVDGGRSRLRVRS
jgi:NAD(P)-dependent dehydrogenase (short-subunit alcohol dehydrogenase family)